MFVPVEFIEEDLVSVQSRLVLSQDFLDSQQFLEWGIALAGVAGDEWGSAGDEGFSGLRLRGGV